MNIKTLLYFGFLSPIIFWITTYVCGLMIQDYNHLSGMVSQLGALGTNSQYWFTIGLVISSVLNIFTVIGLYKVCKLLELSLIPIFFLLLYSFLAGPAIIPMPLRLHGIVGIPFPFLMLSPLFSLIIWRAKEQLLKIREVAIFSLLIMLLGFLIFFPDVLNGYFGLKQRFLYIGWSFWSIYLSYRFLQLIDINKKEVEELIY
ncbi:MAG: DUF998 domain-containing protein [Bacteroidales bacterium]|nr:DUF998 domain-containing protein [Bacteroidales bacterium]